MTEIHYTWQEIETSINNIITQMFKDDWMPNLIIGLTHGSIIPSTMLSNKLDISVVFGTTSVITNDNILILTDFNKCGTSLKKLPNDLTNTKKSRIACILHNEASDVDVDYAYKHINTMEQDYGVLFPWE
jgi:hypoxanthine phosphoribosyltransferase